MTTPFLNVNVNRTPEARKIARIANRVSKRIKATRKPSECIVTYVMPPKPEAVMADIAKLEAVLAEINARNAKLETK
jgi:hypothetical protein